MNKGFTLAEVLITLGIIGVVAALTIPTIIKNSEKQTAISKVKEAYSILAQVTTQINTDCGGDITNCLTDASKTAGLNDDTARAEIVALYKPYLAIIKDCTNATTTGCFANANYVYLDNSGSYGNFETETWLANSKFVLKDGISVIFQWIGTSFSASDPSLNLFVIGIDVNGPKGPNQFGKDTFLFSYNTNKVLQPLRTILAAWGGLNSCESTATGNIGLNCSSKIIQEGAINYY